MSKRNQHVVPHPKGWAVKPANGKQATSVHPTQSAAAQRARSIARNQGSELIIHRQNGQIRERSTYGQDPFPPKG